MNSDRRRYLAEAKETVNNRNPTTRRTQVVPFSPFEFAARTRLQRVLDVEHGGPVSVHVPLNVVFGNVAASVFYPDARFQVVEVAAVELEEFDEQDADVDVGAAHVLPVVKLENTRCKWSYF